jgi:hypothetical protein
MLKIPIAVEVPTSDKPNTAICSACGWEGPIADCDTETEGTWEEGFYQIHICPKCPEGGCIDDYTYRK